MKSKIISLSNKQNQPSRFTQLIDWVFGANTISEPIITEEDKQKRALTYLQNLLNPATSNPLKLLDEDLHVTFSKNKNQLKLCFTGELPVRYNYYSHNARNRYFEIKLQSLINILYKHGICETNLLDQIKNRKHRTSEIEELENTGSNRWHRRKEIIGPKDCLHSIFISITLTEIGISLVEEALTSNANLRSTTSTIK